jgi:methionyl-tRNA synthetase
MPAPPEPAFYLTTPLYYVNARPHLGHAYSTLVADTMVRFQRQQGRDACFLTGTDEHGQKIQRAAEAAGVSPQQFADGVAQAFRAEWDRLGLAYSYFIRTTEPRHAAAVVDIFQRLERNGAVYKGSYSGPYCVSDELFVGEGAEVGAPCPICGRPTERVTEENYYFRLSAFQQPLLDHYRKHPHFIRPETRRNEVVAFVEAGLKDVSISRTSIHWGIPIPGDERHVLYVWFDALIGYLSGIGYGSPRAEDQANWQKLWPAWHLVGKEIVRFHCVYWPAFLMAAGLPLPHGIVAHGWLLFDQEKMSKSVGNVVKAEPIRQVLGADALRHFLLREVSFGQDGNFSYDALLERYNADLANGWGNLASRTLTMIQRYRQGLVPAGAAAPGAAPSIGIAVEEFRLRMAAWDFSRGLAEVWRFIGDMDRYLAAEKPWTLEDQPARLDPILRHAFLALRATAVLLASALPASAQRLWEQLGFTGPVGEIRFEEFRWDDVPPGHRIGKFEALFPRRDKEKTVEDLRQLETAAAAPPAPAAAPAAETKIAIDDFAKVDLRVGQVLTAERIPGADKLLKLTVDIGTEVRQIVAGIALAYDPATLPGRKVVIVANLAPRKLRGLESNGMIVAAAVGDAGTPVLVSVPDDTPNGARLR